MATIESIRSWIYRFDYQGYLEKLPPDERQRVWQQHLDAVRRDEEQRERERAERQDIPRNIDITHYGFSSIEEAQREFDSDCRASEYIDYIPVDIVHFWLAFCHNNFVKKQALENEKRRQREMCELRVRTQEMAKWQMEREEERGVSVKISKRKRLLKWLKRNLG